MKYKYTLSIVLLLLCCNVIAQQVQYKPSNSLAWGYDDVNTGRNVHLVYHWQLSPKWNIYGGVKYLINSKYYKNDPTIYTPFFKEFYAKNTFRHLGIKLGVEKNIGHYGNDLSAFAFYDFQLTAANVENIYKVYGPMGEEEHHDLAINAFENTLGLGALLRLSERTAFRIQAGLGVDIFKWRNGDKKSSTLEQLMHGWSFNRMLCLGLSYDLSDRKSYQSRQSKRSTGLAETISSSLNVAYDDIQTGRNINLVYRASLNTNLSWYGGVKIHINSSYYNDYRKLEQSHYFKQFSAGNFIQRLGIKTGLEYTYPIPVSNVTMFGFYDFQAMRCEVKNLVSLDYFASGASKATTQGGWFDGLITGNDPVVPNPPVVNFRTYGPIIALENYIGIGAKLAINDKINFRIQGGIGYNFYLGPDTYNDYDITYWYGSTHHENVPWTANKSELSRMFSLGLEYKIAKKNR